MSKNIIVLGGSGYIGQHLMREWIKEDGSVKLYSISRNGKPEKLLKELEDAKQIAWLAGDVFNLKSVQGLPQTIDFVANMIGTATAKTEEEFFKVNVKPVEEMIALMKEKGTKYGSYISGAMGMPGDKYFMASKEKGEQLIKQSGLSIEIVKPSLVYGERPIVVAAVPFMYLFSYIPGLAKIRPMHVDKIAEQIIKSSK